MVRLQLPTVRAGSAQSFRSSALRLDTVVARKAMMSFAAASPTTIPPTTFPAERSDVRRVLAVHGRLLVGQVVVERRPCRCRDRRLHRSVGGNRDCEVVVRLVAPTSFVTASYTAACTYDM